MDNSNFLERVTPGKVNFSLWQEHVSRYYFALPFVSQKVVLDIACGTGYGTNLLSKKASMIIGVDISNDAIKYAVENYGRNINVGFVLADAQHLPFQKNAFDVVVSFETVEHLVHYEIFLNEIKYLLNIGGDLIVSTPNNKIHNLSLRGKPPNPYHFKEFDCHEFSQLLSLFSTQMQIYGQCPYTLKNRLFRFLDTYFSLSSNGFFKKLSKIVFKPRTLKAKDNAPIDSAYRVRKIRNAYTLSIPRFFVVIVKNEKQKYS